MKACVNTVNNALNFINRHRSLFDSGKPFTIEIKPFKQPRTLGQNAIMHVLFAEIAEQSGYPPEDVKTLLKEKYSPRIPIEIGNEVAVVPMGTSQMNLDEGAKFIERIYQFGAENGCRFKDQE